MTSDRTMSTVYEALGGREGIDVGLARDDDLRRVLHDYFAWATTDTMARYPHSPEDVPDGLQIPKWSWHGLVK